MKQEIALFLCEVGLNAHLSPSMHMSPELHASTSKALSNPYFLPLKQTLGADLHTKQQNCPPMCQVERIKILFSTNTPKGKRVWQAAQ